MLVYLAENIMPLITPISEFLFSFINVIFMHMFFSYTLGRKKNSLKVYIVSIFLLSIIMFGFALYNSFSSPNMVLLIIMTFIFGMVLFNSSLGQKIFYITIYSGSTIFVELNTFYLTQWIIGVKNTVNLVLFPDSIERIIYRCVTKIIIAFILYFIAKRRTEKVYIPLKYFAFIFCIYTSSVIGLLFLFEVCLHLDINVQKITLISVAITSMSIMLADIFVFIVFELLCKYFNDKQTALLVENQKNLTEKYILQNEKNYKEIRNLWHDLGNHLSIIQTFLKEKQNAKAESYIDEVQTIFTNVPMSIKTGNEIADIVINQKRAIAFDKKIKFDVVVAYISEEAKLNASDLCILLSNSLDNAIEASELIQDEENRSICLKIRTHKQFLLIEVENYIVNAPVFEKGKLKTNKKDKLNHGLGILSMDSIVKKYNGNMTYDYSDNIFRLTIMLNL